MKSNHFHLSQMLWEVKQHASSCIWISLKVISLWWMSLRGQVVRNKYGSQVKFACSVKIAGCILHNVQSTRSPAALPSNRCIALPALWKYICKHTSIHLFGRRWNLVWDLGNVWQILIAYHPHLCFSIRMRGIHIYVNSYPKGLA